MQNFFDAYFHIDGRKAGNDLLCAYFVVECETCYQILLYLAEGQIPEEEEFALSALIWPRSGSLNVSVPQRIRACYEEAARIKNLAPNAYAVQIRRALEALCDERGISEGSLYHRLAHLAKNGDIPPVLAEITEVLRLLGNIGAHGGDQTVPPGHVRVIDEFFHAIVEYVYVASDKVKRFRDKLTSLKDPR
jgi:hypothetical protein